MGITARYYGWHCAGDFRRAAAGLFLLAVVFYGGGCYPEFVSPISTSLSRQMDDRVLGNWVRRIGGREVQQVSFFPRELSDWVDIVFVYGIDLRERYGGANVEVYQGYRALIDGDDYLCFRRRVKDEPNVLPEERVFYIVGYEVDDDVLTIRMLSLDEIEDVIDDGDLEGEVVVRNPDEGVFYDTILVTSSSERVTRVIDDEGIDRLSEDDDFHTKVFYRELDSWRRY
ncbi:hypothetical protein STSP2_00998 [Anaerohalosphaera lusitana]|uniref:Uncharacterized protein n=1 Tax=Anaerohalosphaera lusitana TaxID=1936003 RepID=A0A1U9NK08_9BACT|nr:hypothetical protein [Anaerohalosphaera lusitana]AQT67846.1 hypothetical protein STSP2_00998 [Anaerohalosphaera lusitana]